VRAWTQRFTPGPRGEEGVIDRHPAQAHAGGVGDGIGERRDGGGRARLADPAGGVGGLDHMHLDGGRFVDAEHPIVVEVALLDAAVLDVISPNSAALRPNRMPPSICA
jgi:hypothetical protein